MRILVIDIGGSKIKFKLWPRGEKRTFSSDPGLTPRHFVEKILKATADWKYQAVSIGFPGPVMHGKPAAEPGNLGRGWVKFDFARAFKKRVKIINDAAMQALGSYRGGRMLFLGLGTGLGSTLILDDVIVPLELGELSYSKGKTFAELLGKRNARRNGRARWAQRVHDLVPPLASAFRTDYVVLGGGNVDHLKRLPRGARRGSNDDAFIGGARLWGLGRLRAEPRKHTWVIV